MKILILGGTIVNEGQQYRADVVIEDDRIIEINREGIDADGVDSFNGIYNKVVDATGAYVLPGIIDSHVHFREPGLTHKADMESESRAAAYGGVTSVFEMPNTKPQTTTFAALHDKEEIAKEKMHVNYAFFPGATNDNIEELRKLDVHQVPGIKLFMGSSTGNMLVDKEQALSAVFALAAEMHLPLMAHCEDTETINQHMAYYKQLTGTDDPDVKLHPLIRDEEACYKSSLLGVEMALKHGTQFHVAHVTTAKEITSLPALAQGQGKVTFEVTVAHLLFSTVDYETLGAKIKCNPSVKTYLDRQALRNALTSPLGGLGVATIGTDHAPHTIEEKQGGAAKAMSGMPMIQFSLVAMLSLVDEGGLTMEQLVYLMCHNPATLFSVDDRGYLRKGSKADITIVRRRSTPWTITKDCIQSKCKWSPLEGRSFNWQVCNTIINGNVVYDNGVFDETSKGEHLTFRQVQSAK